MNICLSLISGYSRGNSTFTRTMEAFMSWYGPAFLEASIGPVIRRICEEKVYIEVDPLRCPKGARALEKHIENLVYWSKEFWVHIYDARKACPLYVHSNPEYNVHATLIISFFTEKCADCLLISVVRSKDAIVYRMDITRTYLCRVSLRSAFCDLSVQES